MYTDGLARVADRDVNTNTELFDVCAAIETECPALGAGVSWAVRLQRGVKKLLSNFHTKMPAKLKITMRAAEPDVHAEEGLDRIAQNTTVSNLDTLCKSDSAFLFKDEAAYTEMADYFHQYCFERAECVLDLENLPVRPFSEMVSDLCKTRIYGDLSLPEEEQQNSESEAILSCTSTASPGYNVISSPSSISRFANTPFPASVMVLSAA